MKRILLFVLVFQLRAQASTTPKPKSSPKPSPTVKATATATIPPSATATPTAQASAGPAPASVTGSCGSLHGLTYVWEQGGTLQIRGRLSAPCAGFKISVRNLEGEGQWAEEPHFEGAEDYGAFSLDPLSLAGSQAEIRVESGAEPRPLCVAVREPDSAPRWLCDRPEGAEALAAFWVEKLGLKSSAADQDKGDPALPDLWAGNLTWEQGPAGRFRLRGTLAGSGKKLPACAGLRLFLVQGPGLPPLAAETCVPLDGNSLRMAGEIDLGLDLPLWLRGKDLLAVVQVDPDNAVPESEEMNNITVAQILKAGTGEGPFLLSPGATGGRQGQRYGKSAEGPNLGLADLAWKREGSRVVVRGRLTYEESAAASKSPLRRWVTLTGYLGAAGRPAQARSLRLASDGDGLFQLKFEGSNGGESDSLALWADPEDRIAESREDDNLATCSLILSGRAEAWEPLCAGSSSGPFGFLLQPGFSSPELLGENPKFPVPGGQGDLRILDPEEGRGFGPDLEPGALLVREPPAGEAPGGNSVVHVSLRLRAGGRTLSEDRLSLVFPSGQVAIRRFRGKLFVPEGSEGARLVEITVDPDQERAEDDENNNRVELDLP